MHRFYGPDKAHGFDGGARLPAGTDQRHAAGIFSCHITRRDGIGCLNAHLLEVAVMDDRQQIPAVDVVEHIERAI